MSKEAYKHNLKRGCGYSSVCYKYGCVGCVLKDVHRHYDPEVWETLNERMKKELEVK